MYFLEGSSNSLMRLVNFRYEEIKKAVARLFQTLFQEHGVNCVPISGFEIACRLGIKVRPYSAYPIMERCLLIKMSEEGFFIRSENVIYYNDLRPYPRINFTILHEIGHYVLGHLEESSVAKMEADFFAAYALAPPVLIHKLGITNYQELSTVFGLSIEAANNAYNRYTKWLRYGGRFYTDYEISLCKNFGIAV